jgi:hypothetical protein
MDEDERVVSESVGGRFPMDGTLDPTTRTGCLDTNTDTDTGSDTELVPDADGCHSAASAWDRLRAASMADRNAARTL